MKPIHILCCISIWCIKVSRSSHFNFKEHWLQKPETNDSKYKYQVEDVIFRETESTRSNRNKNSTIKPLATETKLDICNVSGNSGITSRRKKRFIHYLVSYPKSIYDTVDFSHLSQRFLNCIHTTVEAECYEMLPNGSVHVPLYNRLFDKTNYIIRQGLLYVCPDFFDDLEEKFPPNMDTISLVGISISTACIILHMIMFCVVPKLRSIHGYCLFSLCIALLVTYLTFFIQVWVSEHADCTVLGLFKMYSLLASFFWMNIISFDLWHAIRLATSKLRLTVNQSMPVRLVLYSCYAWGMPVLSIILAVIIDQVSEDRTYKLIFRRETCWFQYKTALLLYFALPVFVLLVMNAVFFVISFLMISKSRSDSGSKDDHSLRSQLFMSLRLGSAMGMVWIFGLIATATHEEWIYYMHSLFTALQGVFIFFSFTLNEKTQKACKRALKIRKMSDLSMVSQQTK